jgi:hypothetical protein
MTAPAIVLTPILSPTALGRPISPVPVAVAPVMAAIWCRSVGTSCPCLGGAA